MAKKTIYKHEFFNTTMMCLDGCGVLVEDVLYDNLNAFKNMGFALINFDPNDIAQLKTLLSKSTLDKIKKKLQPDYKKIPFTGEEINRIKQLLDESNEKELSAKIVEKSIFPEDANIIIEIAPHDEVSQSSEFHFSGLNQLLIIVESSESCSSEKDQTITNILKSTADAAGHQLLNKDELADNNGGRRDEDMSRNNWKNIAINVVILAILITLSVALPPSLPLTISLIGLSFLSTAYTSRHYFKRFWQGLRSRQWLNMSTGVSIGWILSLTHALYHTISMPAMATFSMTFMNVGMPVMLITIVNVLDEIQRAVMLSTRRMQLRGMKSLFHFSDVYLSYEPSLNESDDPAPVWIPRPKAYLKVGMRIRILPGECIPVDGKIIQGEAIVDTSILNGEIRKLLHVGDDVPAGSINLGQEILIQAESTAYRSTVNRVWLKANRAQKPSDARQTTDYRFTYLYSALIAISILVAILVPCFLGILTVPIALQSVTGIVFAICPCTMIIAHRLPRLLMQARLNEKGIVLRDEAFLSRFDAVHTVVFDKTGTLTSGDSEVIFPEKLSQDLMERLYLLEKFHGADHPLAKAICNHYEKKYGSSKMLPPSSAVLDVKHRGLAGQVQERYIQVGNYGYVKEANIRQLPESEPFPKFMQEHLDLGYTPIYVAEDGVYQGVIFVKHTVEPHILAALKRFKYSRGSTSRGLTAARSRELHQSSNAAAAKSEPNEIKLVMITGDTPLAATRLNQQCGNVFDLIYARKEPDDKETIVRDLIKKGYYTDLNEDLSTCRLPMALPKIDPKGVWFVGDGLNDAPCARTVSEEGGISCAMHAADKAAFFTDICLNDSLEYLFQWQDLNRRLKRNILQNQGLLLYGAVIFLVLLICLPIAGAGMMPLIPLIVMLSTTFMTLFNAYRMRMTVDVALEGKVAPWPKRWLASDFSLMLLVGGSLLLVVSLLVMTFASGHLALPAFVFSASLAMAVSSGLLLSSMILLGGFTSLALAYLITNQVVSSCRRDASVSAGIEHMNPAESASSASDTTLRPFFRKGLKMLQGRGDVVVEPATFVTHASTLMR